TGEDLARAADVRRDHRRLHRHRLDHDPPERLLPRRYEDEIERMQNLGDVAPLAEEVDVVSYAIVEHELLQRVGEQLVVVADGADGELRLACEDQSRRDA